MRRPRLPRVHLPRLHRARVASWLVGSPADRDRFAEMHARFTTAPVYGLLVGGSTCAAAFTYGWPVLLLVAVASATMVAGMAAHARSRVPEVVAAATFLVLELDLVCSVLLTGGADSALLPLVLVPIFTQAVCFRPVVTAAWSASAALLVGAAALGATALPGAPAAPAHLRLVVFGALLACLGLAARHMADSDAAARGAASLDALTGLFNRRALRNHFADLQARTGLGDAPLGLVMVDIDHFKAVNDTWGHDRGDEVLQEVAHRLSATIRGGDLLYRIGGEEFVVLAPGADTAACASLAERVRLAVGAADVCGLRVTVSAGACSAPATGSDLDLLCRSADQALYAAKRDGRDRVHVLR